MAQLVLEKIVARSSVPPWLAKGAAAAGLAFLSFTLLSAFGSKLPFRVLPKPLLFFTQGACLFGRAATHSIEYRSEGWNCTARGFEPVDVRPYFPIHAGNKENRFHRSLYFYRRNRPTAQALDAYLLSRLDRDFPGRFGGVRFSSVRIPLPAPGAHVERFHYKGLQQYPASQIKRWYWTRPSVRKARCRR